MAKCYASENIKNPVIDPQPSQDLTEKFDTRLVQAVERLEPPWRKRRLTFELNQCDPSETTQAIDRPDVREALCL